MKGFFKPGDDPGMFGQSSQGNARQTNQECCDSFQEQLITCNDLLQCPIIQQLLAVSHPPVTLSVQAALGGMSIGPTQVLNMTQSSLVSNGWLSSFDWMTFNSKVGGSGTLDFVPRWTPNGITLGDSTIQDNGGTASIGAAPNPNIQWQVIRTIASGGVDYAGYFANLGINFGTNIGLYATASGGATNIAILTDGHIQPNAAGVYNIGTTAARWDEIYGQDLFINTAFQFNPGSEAVDRVLRSDATGNASWVDLSTLGGITGSGTVDFIPRWTPSGTQLGDSIIQSSATRASIGLAPVAIHMFSIVTSGGLARGLNVEALNTQVAANFDGTGLGVTVVTINQLSSVPASFGLKVTNISAIAASTHIGIQSSTSGANAGGINIGIDAHATGATTNYGVRSEGHMVPFVTKAYTLGVAALRWTGLFLGCNIDFNDDLLFDFTGTTLMTLKTTGDLGIGITPSEKLQIAGNIAPDANLTRDIGTSSLAWNRLYMGTTGRAVFDVNYIVKSSSANGLEFNVASSVAIWTFGWNNGQLMATGNLDDAAIDLHSSAANTRISMSNAATTRYWRAGKVADDYVIDGILNADGTPTVIFTILNADGHATFTKNLTVSGLLKAGTTPVTLTNAAGKILSAALNTVAVADGGTGVTTFGGVNTLLYTTAADTLASLTLGTALSISGGALNAVGYALEGQSYSGTWNPADSTTYYFGNLPTTAPSTGAGSLRRIGIPKTGTIKNVMITIACATLAGSGESATVFIRLNDTTNANVNTAVTFSSTFQSFSGNPNMAVTAGDYIDVGVTTPAWVTNPLNVGLTVAIYIE